MKCFPSFRLSRKIETPKPSSSEDNVMWPKIDTEKILDGNVVLVDRYEHNSARIFRFSELAEATNNFSDDFLLGEGGFGRVYKGKLQNNQVVAVKQLTNTGLQGVNEFNAEACLLSQLDHPNVVTLIGCCSEGDQRLLVYEYMPLGSVEDHLHDIRPDQKPLDWKTRMNIAYGAAKGLEFLHGNNSCPVIYRDLKSSNILLGEGYHPKLSDLGLAKSGPDGSHSHISTRIMGTYGYCAPEYACTGHLTFKSDIYCFGVFLLELITGRRVFDDSRSKNESILVSWAHLMLEDRRNMKHMVDPLLDGHYSKKQLHQAFVVAMSCLNVDALIRPDIYAVVKAMDFISSKS